MTTNFNAPLITREDLSQDRWLGRVVQIEFGQALILVPAQRLATGAGITAGAHVYVVRGADEFDAGGVGVESSRPYVLRIRNYAEMPPGDTALGRRIRRVLDMDERYAGVDLDDHGLIECDVLGAFFKPAPTTGEVKFSGDVGHLGHPLAYTAFMPSPRVSHLLVNGTVHPDQRIRFGTVRYSEDLDYLHASPTTAWLSMTDIRGRRTAMFGKTRLGKSNVVKLLVQGILDSTKDKHDVGQLIFDVNGEYANSNPQDGQAAIASVYRDRCLVYYLSKKVSDTTFKLLRFNFYERTQEALGILQELLPPEIADSEYVRPLLNCRLPVMEITPADTQKSQQRKMRKIMIFWTLLATAGFEYAEDRLRAMLTGVGVHNPFNPGFSTALRMAAYQAVNGTSPLAQPRTMAEMLLEISIVLRFSLIYPNDPSLREENRFLFDTDEEIMAAFMFPQSGVGPYILRPATAFHSPVADDFITEILQALEVGRTVIVDLGSANERIIRYFGRTLSVAVFQQQEMKFVRNELNDRYVQIYFEEAHMLFPPNSGNVIDVYSRFAKEGAKFNIGMVYSTQSPSTVNHDLLAQTENFFIGHLSSTRETDELASVQAAFKGFEEEIMRNRSPGFMRVMTASHRYPIPIQANRYDGRSLLEEEPPTAALQDRRAFGGAILPAATAAFPNRPGEIHEHAG